MNLVFLFFYFFQLVSSQHITNNNDDVLEQDSFSPLCCQAVLPTPPKNMNTCGGTRPIGLPFATRSATYARNGMAATSQPLSTLTALEILKKGGSAVDAAIAANIIEGVVEPMMNGMGGDLFAQVWENKEKKLYAINSSGRSSKTTSFQEMQSLLKNMNHSISSLPSLGPLSVTVPGAVKGWCELHEKFGKLQWSMLFEAGIKYAQEGFPVSSVISSEWALFDRNNTEITSNGQFPQAADGVISVFTVDQTPRAPRAGEMFMNSALANTLRKVADGGCEEFYNGSIATAIDKFRSVAGTRITADDLRAHTAEWVEPVSTTYRTNYRIFEIPPNPQGLAVLQQMNILEGYNLTQMGFNSADYLHVHLESKKLVFSDRAKYYADPDFVKVPIQGLIDKGYAAARRSLIDMNHAAQRVDAGTPNEHASIVAKGDTIYLTTADADGMMVSLIQSNFNAFGSGLVVPELGFALQDRGSLFNMDASAANSYQPGKRPFHTLIPGFVTKDDEPWLAFGVMGGDMQPQGQAQILSNLIDFGMGLQEAGDAARYYHSGSNSPTGGEEMRDGGLVQLESGVCSDTISDLVNRGHHIVLGPNEGGYQAIMKQPNGVWVGASEMRKDGMAAGY